MTYTYQQAKRDTFTTCPVCGEVFRQDGVGRMRSYCSDACKMKAHRRQEAGKPKRKEVNEVRTGYLEAQIAHHEARQEWAAVDALRNLARHIGAPIDEDQVKHWLEIAQTEVKTWAL